LHFFLETCFNCGEEGHQHPLAVVGRHFSSLFAEVTMYWLMMTGSLWFLLVDDVPVLRLLFNRHVWSFFLHDHPAVCALLAEHLTFSQ
jgi:hypothetical protein